MAQGFNRIEALLEEFVRHPEIDSDDGNEDDADEIDTETDDFNKHDNNCDGNVGRESENSRINESRCEDSGTYICPDEECKTRKADRTWKQYVRHYETRIQRTPFSLATFQLILRRCSMQSTLRHLSYSFS